MKEWVMAPREKPGNGVKRKKSDVIVNALLNLIIVLAAVSTICAVHILIARARGML